MIEKLRKDWENQPLSISVQVLSILTGLLIFIFGNGLELQIGQPAPSTLNTSAGLFLCATPLLAWISGKFYLRSFIAGICISLVLASLSIFLFAAMETDAFLHGAHETKAGVQTFQIITSPLSELVYWATFFIFIGITFPFVGKRLIEINPITIKEIDGIEVEQGGVTNAHLMIIVILWGLLLNGADNRIINYYAADKNIAAIEK